MIFSFSTNSISDDELKEIPGTDIFTYFKTPTSVQVPQELWFQAVCTSLRMKKSVLILEIPGPIPVMNDKKRWETHENWSWLTPRALSVISQAYGQTFMNFQEFKHFLKNSK